MVSAIMAATLLSMAVGLSERVHRRADILTAHDLARAGVEAEIARLAARRPPDPLHGTLAGGSYQASVVSGAGTSTPVIESKGLTLQGGKATLWAAVDMANQSVIAWRETP